MNYQVLARKWRPKKFSAMIGQEHVLRMLINALDQQRLHHAYLFTGTRGVGKTSLARLLAKCLNCETGITSNPCDTCSACVAIDSGRFLDLIEVDAASKTKVEDTRELLENVQYPPNQGRFKIYLIDEVHMLSGHSFNALLKTLEEPPAHVKFLLATTDPKRLPITILSRCLQFNLKRVPAELICKQLQSICESEALAYEMQALEQLAQAADGSMRDALSLMDQAIAFCSQNILHSDVRRMLGNVEETLLHDVLNFLIEPNPQALLQTLNNLQDNAPDYDQVLEDLLAQLQQLARIQLIPMADQDSKLQALAAKISAEDVQMFYQIALIGRRDLPFAPSPAMGFEMIILRMLAFHPPQTTQPKFTPMQQVAAVKNTSTTQPQQPATPPQVKSAPTLPQANSWEAILPFLGLSGMAQALAVNCALTSMDEHEIVLALAKKHEPMLNQRLHDRLQDAVRKYLQKPVNLKFTITDNELETAAKQQERLKTSQLKTAVGSIERDNHVKKMVDLFGATVDLNSVKPIEKTDS